mmetsp:Transcript_5926/g.14741  ORF Transcript_5926/g.14741 Transcript_5926/m.14741 type:complete len:117 (+) Transcript_5926:1065-1415(+)
MSYKSHGAPHLITHIIPQPTESPQPPACTCATLYSRPHSSHPVHITSCWSRSELPAVPSRAAAVVAAAAAVARGVVHVRIWLPLLWRLRWSRPDPEQPPRAVWRAVALVPPPSPPV